MADELALTFTESDNFHPLRNVEKIAAGSPLADDDRTPWIEALARGVNARRSQGDAIVPCYVLKKFRRDRLRAEVTEPLNGHQGRRVSLLN